MTSQSLSTFLDHTASYIESGCQQPIDSIVQEFFTQSPFSWQGFHALGEVLEAEGDTEAARHCYRGQFPAHVQKRFFNEDIDALTGSDFKGVRLDAYPASVVKPVSPSASTSFLLRSHLFRADEPKGLEANPTYAHHFTDISLWYDGFNTVVFNKHGAVDGASLVGNAAPALHAARNVKANHLDGLLVHMGGPGTNNYFHWMTDVLPRLGVLQKLGIIRDKNTRYLFSDFTQEFQRKTLEHFGIDESQIYLADRMGRHITADELVIPVLRNNIGVTMGAWLPDFMRHSFGIDPTIERSRKILVSRDAERSHGRGIINLAEFNQYFLDRGYEPLLPEKYTVAEQAKLFSEATHVAGPHGAGLTNIIFCLPGTKVYEFYGDHLAPCYWAISELSGLDYLNHDCSTYDFENATRFELNKSLGERRASSFSVNLSTIDASHVER